MRSNYEAMEGLVDEGKRVLRIDSTEVRLSNQFIRLLLWAWLALNERVHISRDFFESKRLCFPLISMNFVAPNQVLIQAAGILVIQSTRNEELLVVQRDMGDGRVKLHENTILQVLSLEEGLSVDRAVEQSGEAQIPHQILDILLVEEVLVEVLCVVVQDGFEVESLFVPQLDQFTQAAVE